MMYPELIWIKTGSGQWERGIDEPEEFYHTIARAYKGSGRMFFGMTGFISLSIKLDAKEASEVASQRVNDALQNAWLRLRYDHPTLASWIEYDHSGQRFRKVYKSCEDQKSQHAWIQQTLRHVKTSLSGEEWANSDPPAPSMPTLFVIEPIIDSNQDGAMHRCIVFRSPHDVVDGIGTLQLLNNLFKHASEAHAQENSYQMPIFGNESVNLSPPLRIAASIPRQPTNEQQERLERILAQNRSLCQDMELSYLPFRRGAQVPGIHKRVAIRLLPAKTQQVILACKKVGATITHAYHAAIALALRDLQHKEERIRTVRYLGYCLINHRKHCSAPYSGPKHPVSVIHSSSGAGLAIDLPGPSSTAKSTTSQQEEFDQAIIKVRDYYLSIRDDIDHLSRVPKLWALGTPRLSDETLAGASPTVPPLIQTLHLDDPWVTGEELRTGLGTFLGTWKGSLTFSAAYNNAWHDKQDVLRFLTACERIILTGLAIE